MQQLEEEENVTSVDVCKKDSTEETPRDLAKNKPKSAKSKLKRKQKRPAQPLDEAPTDVNDIKEIKKMESNFSMCSGYSSASSFEESMFWAKNSSKKDEVKPIDPMKQVSILCKKLIGDLVVEDDNISLQKVISTIKALVET